jgi:hypothetical protein
MTIVALPACGFRIGSSWFCIGAKVEVRLFFWKSALVLHFYAHPQEIGLEVPRFVNRALVLRTSFLHNENDLVRPFSAGQELAVTPLRNEYVREHFVAFEAIAKA